MKPRNKIINVNEAIALVKPGARIMVGGFGQKGYPEILIDTLAKSKINGLTIISNDLGSPGEGLGKLLTNKQIKGLVGNYYNWNPDVADAYNAGKIDVTLLPQGTFAEAIRAAGAGISAFYTPTGAGTELGKGKEMRVLNNCNCVLEYAIYADVALIKAHKADTLGNLVYYKTARNFNPAMASAATLTIAQVDEIVQPGEIDPENIITPHIFVDAICKKE